MTSGFRSGFNLMRHLPHINWFKRVVASVKLLASATTDDSSWKNSRRQPSLRSSRLHPTDALHPSCRHLRSSPRGSMQVECSIRVPLQVDKPILLRSGSCMQRTPAICAVCLLAL